MKAVVLDMPQEWLDERRRLDLDRKDEMWEGVLHMVPPASSEHNELGADLMRSLGRLATERGLRRFFEPGIFDPAVQSMTSYRVADLGFAQPEHVTRRGIEGRATLVVEILSSSDESYNKLPFYRRVGVDELLYIDPITRSFEVRRPDGDGWAVVGADDDGWVVAGPDHEGRVELTSLCAQVRTVSGRLQVRTLNATEVL